MGPQESATSGRVPGALNGREFIDTLERKGLFCVALDEGQEWYRYHHLFREVLQSGLRDHLERREIAALHGRAADWLESRGSIDQALRHHPRPRPRGVHGDLYPHLYPFGTCAGLLPPPILQSSYFDGRGTCRGHRPPGEMTQESR